MADAVIGAKAGQKTPDGYYNIERMLKRVLAGRERSCCAAPAWKPAVSPTPRSCRVPTVAPWTRSPPRLLGADKVLVF